MVFNRVLAKLYMHGAIIELVPADDSMLQSIASFHIRMIIRMWEMQLEL
jgi:hypothetical protein